MRGNPFFSRVGELIRSPSAPRVARWLPPFLFAIRQHMKS